MPRVDEEEKTMTLVLWYWGPFLAGKSTSSDWVRSRMTGAPFEPDDEPFRPSLAAARDSEPPAIAVSTWTSPPFSKLGELDVRLQFSDRSGLPPREDWEPARLYHLRMMHPGIDAIVFVASSAAEDVEANRESLEELRAHGLLDRTILQANKQDVPSALDPSELARRLGIEDRPVVASEARTGNGVLAAVQAAVHVALTRAAAGS